MRKSAFAIALIAQALTLGSGDIVHAATSPEQNAIQSGSAALQAGSFKAAIDQFTKALATGKLSAKTAAITLLNRGLAYQQHGMLVEALNDYDRALQKGALPAATRAVTLYNRGLANRKLYRTTLALEDFTNALMLNPKFPQAYNSRANILRELGYYTTAIEDYSSAVRYKHPQIHIPLYGKALSHAALRNLPAAKTALSQALQFQPKYKAAKSLLARITKVPGPGKPDKPRTVIAGNNADPVSTGAIKQATTVMAKNNLPWAPAQANAAALATLNKPSMTRVSPDSAKPVEIATTSSSQLSSTDMVASPTAAQAGTVNQNVVTSNETEDPSVRTNDAPGKTLVYVPLPGSTQTTNKQEPLKSASLAPVATTAAPGTTPKGDEYLIQLSAQTNPQIAQNLWDKMSAEHSDILGDLTPYIIRVEIDGKGTIYRVRAGGFGSRAAGTDLCKQLKRRRVACYVAVASN